MSVDPRLQELLSRAFHVAPAADANTEIARMREEQGSELAEALSYEAVIPDERPVEFLVETLLPKLVYFLDSRGAKLPRVGGLFLSLFAGDRLHFVPVEGALDLLAAWSGLDYPEMVRRWGASTGG